MIYILLAFISILMFAIAVVMESGFINFISALVMVAALTPAIDWAITYLKVLS